MPVDVILIKNQHDLMKIFKKFQKFSKAFLTSCGINSTDPNGAQLKGPAGKQLRRMPQEDTPGEISGSSRRRWKGGHLVSAKANVLKCGIWFSDLGILDFLMTHIENVKNKKMTRSGGQNIKYINVWVGLY